VPEAPEIEKLKRSLEQEDIWDKEIEKCEVSHPNIIKNSSVEEFQRFFVGRKFLYVSRFAKYLQFVLADSWSLNSNGDPVERPGVYLAHQRFTGWFGVQNDIVKRVHSLNANKSDAVTRIKWWFKGSDKPLIYRDPRVLSHHKIVECPANVPIHGAGFFFKELVDLGPDVLSGNEMGWEVFWRMLDKFKRRDVKSVLLDQRALVSGIGNYLACEILDHIKMDPWKKVGDLTEDEQKDLRKAMYLVPYTSLEAPDYDWFNVFRRSTCKRCEGKIKRLVHKPGKVNPTKGQATYFCPNCVGVSHEVMSTA